MTTRFTTKLRLAVAALLLMQLGGGVANALTDMRGSIPLTTQKPSEYPHIARINMDDAVRSALQQVPGRAVGAELESQDGYLVYNIDILANNGKEYEVSVDAGNSRVLRYDLKETLVDKIKKPFHVH